MGKTVLVVGDISPDSSRYTYASSFVRTFDGLGYNVHTFSPTKLKRNSMLSVNIQRCFQIFDQRKIITHARTLSPDIIFVIKGNWLSSHTIKVLKSKTNACLVHFYPDNPFTFWNGNSQSSVLECLPYWDHFLIWSKMLIEPLYSAGCKRVHYFPFAYDHTIFKPDNNLLLDKNYRYEVSFIGTWEPAREQWLTYLKERLPNLNLYIWGNGWYRHVARDSVLYGSMQGQAIYGQELVQVMQFSKIVLNFLREQNMHAHNMRTFEVPAVGAFLLTERTRVQAQDIFIEDQSIACFDSYDELVGKVTYFLAHDGERAAIAQKGHSFTKSYTLLKVVDKLMCIIDHKI